MSLLTQTLSKVEICCSRHGLLKFMNKNSSNPPVLKNCKRFILQPFFTTYSIALSSFAYKRFVRQTHKCWKADLKLVQCSFWLTLNNMISFKKTLQQAVAVNYLFCFSNFVLLIFWILLKTRSQNYITKKYAPKITLVKTAIQKESRVCYKVKTTTKKVNTNRNT